MTSLMLRIIAPVLLVSACAGATPSAAGQGSPCSPAGTRGGTSFCLARLHGRGPRFRILPTHHAKIVVVHWSFQCPVQSTMTAGFPRFRLTLLTDAPHASDVNVSVESKSADVGVKTTPTERASTIAIFVAID